MTALHPTREQIQLVEVLAALGHPVRAQIVRTLSAQPPDTEMFCGSVLPDVPKSTLTNHWRVLRRPGSSSSAPRGASSSSPCAAPTSTPASPACSTWWSRNPTRCERSGSPRRP
ncbi:ArsR/SmtB family transcription factor [Nonomuraea recticatena]|uniref:ArsR/SmtB family transcription factor n=1 Tax=Nonomuraea recticatena TaxID=46178 RepID=UPI00362285A5